MRNGLAANEIDVLAGIVNGTSNYILTAVEDEVGNRRRAEASPAEPAVTGVVCPHCLKIPAIDPPGVFAEVVA